MIAGAMYGPADAIVELAVLGPDGRTERVDARIDTGFDGDLSLHSAIVSALGLQPSGGVIVVLGDGSRVLCQVCDAYVEWDGALRSVGVQVSDTIPLLGMALLAGHELRIEVADGGFAGISPLP